MIWFFVYGECAVIVGTYSLLRNSRRGVANTAARADGCLASKEDARPKRSFAFVWTPAEIRNRLPFFSTALQQFLGPSCP